MAVQKTDTTAAGSERSAAGSNANDWLPGPPHTLEAEVCVKAFKTDVKMGLSEAQVAEYQATFGPNKLQENPPISFWSILVRNVLNAMTLVLIAAMAVSFGTMDWVSGGVIAALVILNVGVGTVNEFKAEKTVAALEAVGSPVAVVIRQGKNTKGHEGETQTIQTAEVVPGDIVLVKIGDIVPADCRVLPEFLSGLEVDEALLTGESLPVDKQGDPIEDPVCPVGDRTSMIYSGSQVTKGRARTVCVATGMNTELGKIQEAMGRKEKNNKQGFARTWHKIKVFLGVAETTPLQVKLNTLAYILFGVACLLALIVVASTGFSDVPLTIATYAVAAAVSLLPASLPAVVALSLANASRTLAESNALVRKMDAIETLAAVTDVCSDKTGTITLGKMVMQRAWIPAKLEGHDEKAAVVVNTREGQLYTVETGSDPYYPRGRVLAIGPDEKGDAFGDDEDSDDPDRSEDLVDKDHMERPLRDFTLCASLCSSATLQRVHHDEDDPTKGRWEGHGDATEVALQVYAFKVGHGRPHLTHKPDLRKMNTAGSDVARVPKTKLQGHYEQLVEHAFDSTIKRMSVAYRYYPAEHADPSDVPHTLVVMKGAYERVFSQCTKILMGDDAREMTEDDRANVQAQYDKLASQGLRVLTLCGKKDAPEKSEEFRTMERDNLEQDMCFFGLAGIYDPPRPESAEAVANCHQASIVPRMLTGDHLKTATAIAQLVGIIGYDFPKEAVMTGPQFDALSEDEIDNLSQLPRVVARCAPETKVRMVEALHRRKKLCVMTGDGVNDAPSLKRADVGVAMGLNGSDVAKQSAEIVLSDDNFSTIIEAVRKGRGIFFNLQKFMLYLLSGNLAEVLVMMIGLAFIDQNGESTFPISPVGALWINTLAAGPPALALGLEPTPDDAMERGPRDFQVMFTKWWFIDLVYYGFLMAGLALANFSLTVWGYFDGYLGYDCNEGLNDTVCDATGQARGACFSAFLITLMAHAFTCKHPTRSIFQMSLLDNKILLASSTILMLSVFPVIYIPVINEKVFLMSSLTWEWGMVFASVLVYIAFAEGYKVLRRHFEHTKEERRLAQFTTMDNKVIARMREKRRVKKSGEKAV